LCRWGSFGAYLNVNRITLSHDNLLRFAQDESVSNALWATFMSQSRGERHFYNQELAKYNAQKSSVEYGVKATVPIVLGVGLMLSAPASMLLCGAAATLALGTLILNAMKLDDYTLAVPEQKNIEDSPSNGVEIAKFRQQWATQASFSNRSANQELLHTNMLRVGVGLVSSFAAFAAVASGAAIPLTLYSMLFASTLFYKPLDATSPYIENEEAQCPAPTA
jgi:hypothetical protein